MVHFKLSVVFSLAVAAIAIAPAFAIPVPTKSGSTASTHNAHQGHHDGSGTTVPGPSSQ
jgi:hypothetical protein